MSAMRAIESIINEAEDLLERLDLLEQAERDSWDRRKAEYPNAYICPWEEAVNPNGDSIAMKYVETRSRIMLTLAMAQNTKERQDGSS